MISISVVCVDDSKVVLGFMEDYLSEINKTIPLTYKTFLNALSAISYIHSHTVDVVISDVEMDTMSGIELIKSVKEHNNNIRCVILSSLKAVEDFHKGKEAGVDNYLTKPPDLTHLRSILRLASLKKQQE